MKRLFVLLTSMALMGCGSGYSVRAIHLPSTAQAIDQIRADAQLAKADQAKRFGYAMEVIDRHLPAIVEYAKTHGDPGATLAGYQAEMVEVRNAFAQSGALNDRIITMADALEESLGTDDTEGNIDPALTFAGGAGLAALAIAAF